MERKRGRIKDEENIEKQAVLGPYICLYAMING